MASRIQLQLLDTKGIRAPESFLSPRLQQAKRISLMVLTILFCAAFVTSVALLAFTAPFHLGLLVIPIVVSGAALCLAFGLFSLINLQKKKEMALYLSKDINYHKKEEMASHLRNDSRASFVTYLSRNGQDISFLVNTGYLTIYEGRKLTELVNRYRVLIKQVEEFIQANTHLMVTDNDEFFESRKQAANIDIREYPQFIQNLALWKANPHFK